MPELCDGVCDLQKLETYFACQKCFLLCPSQVWAEFTTANISFMVRACSIPRGKGWQVELTTYEKMSIFLKLEVWRFPSRVYSWLSLFSSWIGQGSGPDICIELKNFPPHLKKLPRGSDLWGWGNLSLARIGRGRRDHPGL